MLSSAISTTFKSIARRGSVALNQHAPEILMGIGVLTGIGATVCACRATLQAQDVLAKAHEDLDAVHEAQSRDDIPEEEYSEEDAKKDKAIVYVRTAVDFTKLYAPAIILGATSFMCFFSSHRLLTQRLSGALAACTALDQSFKAYRKRVRDSLGVEKELELYHGVKALKGGTRDENGLVKIDPKKSDQIKVDGYSIYARCFDEYNKNWKDDPEYNLMFLRSTQRYLQALLERDGFLTLNDAYRELGFEATNTGAITGWIYDPDNPNHIGDNVVSFGLYDPEGKHPALGDFINGKESCVFLDFNVDGVIIDKISGLGKRR